MKAYLSQDLNISFARLFRLADFKQIPTYPLFFYHRHLSAVVSTHLLPSARWGSGDFLDLNDCGSDLVGYGSADLAHFCVQLTQILLVSCQQLGQLCIQLILCLLDQLLTHREPVQLREGADMSGLWPDGTALDLLQVLVLGLDVRFQIMICSLVTLDIFSSIVDLFLHRLVLNQQ